MLPSPPSAPTASNPRTGHGRTRVDPWSWLDDQADPQVIAHLNAENAYAEAVMAPTNALQEALFDGIRSRTAETDAGPPSRSDGWWYYTRTEAGLQYGIECRLGDPDQELDAAAVAELTRAGRPDAEQVLLDPNRLVGSSEYLDVGILDVSPGGRLMAYGLDLDGSELFTVRFRDLTTAGELDDVIAGVYYSSAWTASSEAFFYVRPDETMRPWQVWCHVIGSDVADDCLVYEEQDERFFVEVSLSRSESRVVIATASKTSSEVRWLDAASPSNDREAPQVLIERRPDVEYDAEHDGGDSWLVRINLAADGAPSGPGTEHSLWRFSERDRDLKAVLEPRSDTAVVEVEAFSSFAAVIERSTIDGLERIRIIDRSGRHSLIDTPQAPYALLSGGNPAWEQETFRYGYTSLVAPRTWVDHTTMNHHEEVIWAQNVPGYDKTRYRTERVWAVAADHTRIPVSVVSRADYTPNGTAPGVIYGYGAYEIPIEPVFSVSTLNLLDHGAVFAIAHVRGGGELGKGWHEAGRMERKANSFSDFIACAEALVDQGWINRDRIAARGGSAGGLLMGAVTNMRPDLWRAVVAEVPFVDVVTTMSDPSLPLTVTEWEEWGDPLHDAASFERMLEYSPYDNVVAREQWPAMYVTAGLNDPRVGFWEPAKWVAKLRWAGAGKGDRPVVFFIEMGAGHQGPSGRYEGWRDEARVQAFLLSQLGLAT